MQNQNLPTEEMWVKILSKGLVTIPKKVREKIGIKEGDVAKAKVSGNSFIIEPRESGNYRLFTDKEIRQWIKDDKLPPRLAKKAAAFWADLP